MNLSPVAYRIGKTALKIYANHLLSFTIGAIGGGITVAGMLMPFLGVR